MNTGLHKQELLLAAAALWFLGAAMLAPEMASAKPPKIEQLQ